MIVFFILFFLSLVGIAFMIGRKLALLGHPHHAHTHHHTLSIEVPEIEQVKSMAVRGARKVGYIALVSIIRAYVLSAHFTKSRYAELKEKIKKMKKLRGEEESSEEIRPNKFLKMMSDYKQKIKKIKLDIKEEEGIE